jgi:hypothetical protein
MPCCLEKSVLWRQVTADESTFIDFTLSLELVSVCRPHHYRD